jgi:hypothetical protein
MRDPHRLGLPATTHLQLMSDNIYNSSSQAAPSAADPDNFWNVPSHLWVTRSPLRLAHELEPEPIREFLPVLYSHSSYKKFFQAHGFTYRRFFYYRDEDGESRARSIPLAAYIAIERLRSSDLDWSIASHAIGIVLRSPDNRLLIEMLLLLAGVEPNPGPITRRDPSSHVGERQRKKGKSKINEDNQEPPSRESRRKSPRPIPKPEAPRTAATIAEEKVQMIPRRFIDLAATLGFDQQAAIVLYCDVPQSFHLATDTEVLSLISAIALKHKGKVDDLINPKVPVVPVIAANPLLGRKSLDLYYDFDHVGDAEVLRKRDIVLPRSYVPMFIALTIFVLSFLVYARYVQVACVTTPSLTLSNRLTITADFCRSVGGWHFACLDFDYEPHFWCPATLIDSLTFGSARPRRSNLDELLFGWAYDIDFSLRSSYERVISRYAFWRPLHRDSTFRDAALVSLPFVTSYVICILALAVVLYQPTVFYRRYLSYATPRLHNVAGRTLQDRQREIDETSVLMSPYASRVGYVFRFNHQDFNFDFAPWSSRFLTHVALVPELLVCSILSAVNRISVQTEVQLMASVDQSLRGLRAQLPLEYCLELENQSGDVAVSTLHTLRACQFLNQGNWIPLME